MHNDTITLNIPNKQINRKGFVMNKLLLVLLCISAVITFCFLAPLYLVIFGLCILLSGLIGISNPERMKIQSIQRLFRKRVTGAFVGTIGALLFIFGSISTYQLYLVPDSKENIFDLSNQNPKAFGSNTTRPGTNHKKKNSYTIQQKVVKEIKELITQSLNPETKRQNSTTPITSKKLENNTTNTSLLPSKSTTLPNSSSQNIESPAKNDDTEQNTEKDQQNNTGQDVSNEPQNSTEQEDNNQQNSDTEQQNNAGQNGDKAKKHKWFKKKRLHKCQKYKKFKRNHECIKENKQTHIK